MRKKSQIYPDYSAEIAVIKEGIIGNEGLPLDLLHRIIRKHRSNSLYNKKLYERYEALDNAVPIFSRRKKFEDESPENKINNDFFGEIIDFKVGYFAGKPISYYYSRTDEAEKVTGGEIARETAAKTLSDYITRNNMFDVDMDITKYASICGYAARLFYIDTDGNERCMAVEPFKCIILSSTTIAEPEFAIRYYETRTIHDESIYKAEFYDDKFIYYYEGTYNNLHFVGKALHCFDYCPLQGIENNKEMLGDAEKVLALIDDYDKVLSDNSNEIEAFVHAYMVFDGIKIVDEEIKKARKNGAFVLPARGSNTSNQGLYWLTKDINDTFTEHQLERVEKNIYRFSKTPNLNDESFGSASGVSLKFKLTGLETKCGMFQAKMMTAGTFMFKLLSTAWSKKKITVEPLQCVMEFTRNFPLDVLSEAQAAQAAIGAGLPKEVAYSMCFSSLDDIDYVMKLIDEEKQSVPSILDEDEDDDDISNVNNNSTNDNNNSGDV